MTALEQLIKEVRKARQKAKSGSWHGKDMSKTTGESEIWICFEDYGSIASVRNGAEDDEYGGEETMRANADFISLAANKIELLLEIIEWQNEALKDVLWQAEYGEIGSCGESARSVLVEIEALIKEEK